MRRLDAAQVGQLLGLVLGEESAGDDAAEMLARTGGDVRLLLARLLVLVQEGHAVGPERSQTSNGLGSGASPVAFRLEGEHWAVTFAGRTVHLRDTRGLRYVAALVDHPGEAMHVFDLVQRGGRQVGRGANPDRARQTVTKCIGLALRKIDVCHPALGAHLRTSVRRGVRCAYRPVRDL